MALVPAAERDEVLAELQAEHASRRATEGWLAARVWLWRQMLSSLPALTQRAWWRGWTGFEPSASRFRPGGHMLESWIMDVRYSVRRLSSRPAYTVLAVVTLALGAAGTAAIFSVARPLLFEPLPFADEHDVGVLWMPGGWNEQEFLHLRPEFPGFAGMAAYRPEGATFEQPGAPLRLVQGSSASAELFDVLGRRAFLGRTFQPGDDVQGAERVVVLSYGFWQELGGRPGIIGRQLSLGGIDRTVIGVMPRGFWFPDPATRLWLSRSLNPERGVGELALIGRVAPGSRIDALDGPLRAIAARLGERFEYPPGEWDKTRAPAITPAREFLVGDVRPGLVATFAAMALILLIACVNVATLMLGQVSGRNTELAVRAALGAGRERLMRQIVVESLVIGGLAGIGGAALAAIGFQVLVSSLPLGALADTAALDWRLFWAATFVALVAAALVALVPGLALWQSNLQGTIVTQRTGGISGRGGRLEAALVVGQIALAVLLAAGAGLLIRSVTNLRAIDPGIDVTAVAVLDATAPTGLTLAERRQSYLDAVQALQALPMVQSAAAAQRLPLLGSSDNWSVLIEGRPDLQGITTSVRIVTHDYFEVLGIQVRRGRGFQPTDQAGTERVVVVNEAFALRYFDVEDPLGRVLHTGLGDDGERIIGVVNNVSENRLIDAHAPARYMLYDQMPGGLLSQTSFVLRARSEGDLPTVIQIARGTLQRDAPRLAVHQVTTMQAVFDRAVGPAGQVVTLVTLLAGLALLLGAIGVYGVISHVVSRRTRDYGVQIALGLRADRLVLQVLGRGMRLVALGSVAGIAAAFLLTHLLSSLLYGVGAADPLALAGAVVTLLIVGSLAALVPALRASRTDPVAALRQP